MSIMKPKKSTNTRCVLSILALLAVGLLSVPSCVEASNGGPSVSSETHFLQRCDSESACGEALSCLCGACTRTCEETSACARLTSAAVCLPVASRPSDPACPETAVVSFCDVSCAKDEDCVQLGNAYRCDRGFCRALNDGCPTGETQGNEVVLLGDATIATNDLLRGLLEDLARASGALASNESYRDYSETLDNHLGGEDPGIFRQYAAAQQDGPVKVVIMDGGAGDLVTNGCPDPIGSDCPTIVEAVAGASALWDQMADDGVEHVVFFFYPDNQVDPSFRTMADTLRPLLEQACASAPLACHWLDLRAAFAGKYDEYYVPDDITKTEAGELATARAIWGVMEQHCVAQ